MEFDKSLLSDLVRKLSNWIDNRRVVQPSSKSLNRLEEKSSVLGWVVGLIVSVLAFILLAFLAWKAWKKGKEIAQLKHVLDVQKEIKAKTVADSKVSQIEEDREYLISISKSMDLSIEDTKKEIDMVEEERKELHSKIDNITSWGGVDNLLGD
jgi:flagellar biosynthesis component FlhA